MTSSITRASTFDVGIANDAIAQWQHGAAEGDWAPMLSLLDEDVTFHVPVDEFAGIQTGSVAAAQFFAHLAKVFRAKLRVVSVMANGPRVAFEVTVQGTLDGLEYAQRLCLVFLVRNGHIGGFYEYLARPGGYSSEDLLGWTASPDDGRPGG